MDQDSKGTIQLQPSAENNHVFHNMADKLAIFATSIPIGQFAFQKIDGSLQVVEEIAKYLQSAKNKEDCNGISKGSKGCQNGHSHHVHAEEVPLPYDTRPLLSLLFFPFIFFFILCQFYVNIILFMVNKPPLKSADIERSTQKIRRHLTDLRLIGSKNIRNKQKLTAQRLNQNPPQLNFICRTFSKWPLKLFVRRLRKVLNFLGIITLPLPGDLKPNSVPPQKDQKPEEQLIKNNETPNAPEIKDSVDGDSSSEEKYDEEYEDDYEDPVKTEPSRRVSVTVQEIILEENEEESITNLKIMKDQLNGMESDQTEASDNNMSNENVNSSHNFSLNEPLVVN